MSESFQEQNVGKGNRPLPNSNNKYSVVTIDEYLKDLKPQIKFALFGGYQNYSMFSRLVTVKLNHQEKYPTTDQEIHSFIKNSISSLVD